MILPIGHWATQFAPSTAEQNAVDAVAQVGLNVGLDVGFAVQTRPDPLPPFEVNPVLHTHVAAPAAAKLPAGQALHTLPVPPELSVENSDCVTGLYCTVLTSQESGL